MLLFQRWMMQHKELYDALLQDVIAAVPSDELLKCYCGYDRQHRKRRRDLELQRRCDPSVSDSTVYFSRPASVTSPFTVLVPPL